MPDHEEAHEVISAEDIAKLDRATRTIQYHKRAMERAAYQIGRELLEVQASGTYRARHNTFDDYLIDEVGIGASTGHRYKRLAESFEEPIVNRIGAEKLELMLPFVADLPVEKRSARLAEIKIPVKDRKGKVAQKPLLDASLRDLRRARDAAKEKARERAARSMPDREEAERFVTIAREALQAAKLHEETWVAISSGWNGEGCQISLGGVDVRNAPRTFGILQHVAEDVLRWSNSRRKR